MAMIMQKIASTAASRIRVGRVRMRFLGVAVLKGSSKQDHFGRGFGGALAGVTMLPADPVDRLLFGIGRQDAKDNRQRLLDRDKLDAPRAFAGDVIEMRRIPANHATQAN